VDNLASLLLDRRQGDEGAGWCDASFFLKLPLGGFEQVFARLNLALGNRPNAVVLVLEIGTARMGKKHLQLAIVNAVHQQTGTDTGHGQEPPTRTTISLFYLVNGLAGQANESEVSS
jgi:hypothetical protein